MRYILFEIQKLFTNKYVVYFMILLFLLNGAVCVYYVNQSDGGIPQRYINEIFSLYETNPVALDEEYAQIKELSEYQRRIYLEQMRAGNYDFRIETVPNKYAPEGFTDIQLLETIFNRKRYIEDYAAQINLVLHEAAANLNQYDLQGIAIEEYIYQYQLKLIQTYLSVRDNVEIKYENSRGWDTYFGYDISNLFIFLSLILIGCVLVIQEKNAGICPLLRVSRNGRTKTAFAKIGTMVVITVSIVLMYALEVLAIVGLHEGYSNPYNAIQAFSEFLYCPYSITVGEYWLITISVRILTFILFSAIIMCIAVFTYNYALGCIGGLGVFGINFLFYILQSHIASKLLNTNLITTGSVTPLFERYRAVNICGYVVDYLPFIVSVYITAYIILCIVVVIKNNSLSRVEFKRILKLPHVSFKLERSVNQSSSKPYTSSLVAFEIYKTLISSRLIIAVAVLMVIKYGISHFTFQPADSYGEAIYYEYMNELAGELTDAKEQYIFDKRYHINSILTKEEDMRQAYMNDDVSLDEYKTYLNEYNYAYIRNEYLAIVETHAEYIDKLAEEDREAWFVYDTGWNALFFSGFDWTLYAIILLLCCGSFAGEYEHKSSASGFVQILQTARHGRKRTLHAKYISAAMMSLLLLVVWNAIDILHITNVYELPMIHAPLYSLESFETFLIEITILEYIVFYFIVKAVAILSLMMMVCSLSALLRKHISVLITSSVLTILPSVISYFGLTIFNSIDYCKFSRVTPMLLQGWSCVCYVLGFIIVTVILRMKAERGWDR